MFVLGAIAFWLPGVLTATFAPSERLSEFLDGALYFQIVGYFLGALLVTYMIRRLQGGDWSTLGLTWDRDVAPRELLRGAGFGLVLIACFMPIGFLLSGGRFEVTGLIRVLVGSTSGLGLLLGGIVVVIGAPVMEEIYYRGILYEKLARRNTGAAIIVTTFLFTAAHGSVFIPAIILLGITLAWRRQSKGLWYTIGAHSAWNLVITVMAAFVLLGASSFSPVDGSYAIDLPRSWDHTEERVMMPISPGTEWDLVATTNNGSDIGILRVPVHKGSASATAEHLADRIDLHGALALPRTQVQGHDHLFDEGAESANIAVALAGPREVASHLFVLVRPGSTTALVFNLVCERRICPDDVALLSEAMHEMDLAPNL